MGDIARIQTVKTSNAQDISSATPVLITFDGNDFITDHFTHTSGSANITINTTGTYEISYNITFTGDDNRKTQRCSVYVDGVEDLATITYAYTRNTANAMGSCTLPPFELSLTATEVITIRGEEDGTSGTATTLLNSCWVRIKKIS